MAKSLTESYLVPVSLTCSGTGIKSTTFQIPRRAMLRGIDLSARCTGVSNGDTFDGLISATDLTQTNGIIQGGGNNGTGTTTAPVFMSFKITTLQGGTTSSAAQFSVNKFITCAFLMQPLDMVWFITAATGPAGLATAILQLEYL